ncbi:MAG TPA: DUF3105 domain-containing protein [Conexibacter sp.]|nr:DUF3105 domain-containing protein [Conexibacter sp.]
MASEHPPTSSPHPRLRRLGLGVLTAVVALAGVVALLLILQGRDRSQLQSDPDAASGPGQVFPDQGHAHLAAGERPDAPYASNPPTSGAHAPVEIGRDGTRVTDDQLLHALELGDVILLYGTPRPPAGLQALAQQVAGPFDPALAASGQAVVLGSRPGVDGVVALAWRHMLRAPTAADPALEEFAAYWLGRGASG